MRKILLSTIFTLFTTIMFAQLGSTKFLGIPIDGTKTEMINKLKAKGYVWNPKTELLEGEFNGRNVKISIQTNNNKVYRLGIIYASGLNTTDVKIYYNNLSQQFQKNERYRKITESNNIFYIPDYENIAYNISIENKRYQAVFLQVSNSSSDLTVDDKELKKYLRKNNVSEEEINNLSESEKNILTREYINDKLSNNIVWFMIDESYGEYSIFLFYENKNNEANGDDL